MNSLVLTIVEIDGSGNGMGTIKLPMLNGARVGLKLSGIQAVKGGCIVAGRAELGGVPMLNLDAKLKENLESLAMGLQVIGLAGQEYATEIANGINASVAKIEELGKKLTEKKRNTQALLAENDLTQLDAAVGNCNEIATDSKAMMDSLSSLICKVKAGTLKANLKKLEKSLNDNKAFMDKLGPALAECPNSNFTPWEEKPCTGGPCAFEWENLNTTNFECYYDLTQVFKSGSSNFGDVNFQSVVDPSGKNQQIPKTSIPLINAKGSCSGFIYDERVYEFVNDKESYGYFVIGQAHDYRNSHIWLVDDIVNKKENPFSWALNKVLYDIGQSFINFGEDPVHNNPVVGLVKLAKAIPNLSVDKTIDYLKALDKDDAYYVTASVIIGGISSGGFSKENVSKIYALLTGKTVITTAKLAALCFKLPANCGNIQNYLVFVEKNLSLLMTSQGRAAIWELGIKAGNAGMRGNIIEKIFALTKYKEAKNLNAIKNNFPGADFDAVSATGNQLISLKTFHVEPNSMDKLKTTLRTHANSLADANLATLSTKAGYNLKGHSKVLDFVIKKGDWDMGIIDTYKKSLLLDFSKKGINLDITISEF